VLKPKSEGLRRKGGAQAGVPVPLKAHDAATRSSCLPTESQRGSKKPLPQKLQTITCLAVRLRRVLRLAGVEVGAMIQVGDEADLGWAPVELSLCFRA
jgi:hypothetical protein